MKVATGIAALKYRVALCTQHDVVNNADGTMELRREAVVWTWAEIAMQWNVASFISKAGFAIKELADRNTHFVTIRASHGLDVRSMAWIYEQRLKSPPRWYKVVGVGEADQWQVFTCHLVEASDDVRPPINALSPQQS